MASAATLLGAPITDPRLILRSSLPKEAQLPALLEVDDNIRAIGGSKASQRSAAGSRSISQSSILEQEASSVDAQMLDAAIRRASVTINNQYDTIFAAMPTRNLSVAKELLGELRGRMSSGLPESRSKQGVTIAEITSFKNDMLNITGQLQSLLVDDVSVPAEYSSLPQLRGRAVAEVKLKSSKREEEDNILTVVLDGINAPITAGNFVDLSLRGFYNDMPIQVSNGFLYCLFSCRWAIDRQIVFVLVACRWICGADWREERQLLS